MNPYDGAPVTLLLARAFNYAAVKHAAQVRKGEAREPYINHLAEVAELVAEATLGADANLVAAALLHDVVEDTATTFSELSSRFGEDVATLVAEVTDDKSLPKAERKRLQVAHAPSRSPRAKILKLADKTSNLRALAASPPVDWSPDRRRAYVEWGREVVAGLRGACPELELLFDEAAAAADREAGGELSSDQRQCGNNRKA